MRHPILPRVLATALAAAATLSALPAGAPAAPTGEVVALPNVTPGYTNASPFGLTTGPDGNIWVVSNVPEKVMRITPAGEVTQFTGFDAGALPNNIVSGPDGNLWITAFGGPSYIYKLSTSGALDKRTAGVTANFPVGSIPAGITVAPDGTIWFVGSANPGRVQQLTTGFVFTDFQAGVVPGFTANGFPYTIAAGSDGNFWFTERADPGRIGRITPAGVVTEFTAGITPNNTPDSITAGPDGNLWFTEAASPNGAVGRITPGGVVTEFATPGHSVYSITAGPDGNLWFNTNDSIGRITTSGKIDHFTQGIDTFGLHQVAPGPDGALWYTNQNTGEIGRIFPGPLSQTGAARTIGQSSVTIDGVVRPNGQATNFYAEAGTTTAYGVKGKGEPAGSGVALVPVSQKLTGLKPSTTYHYRLAAANAADTTLGQDSSFTTAPGVESASAKPRRFSVNRRGRAEKVVSAKRRKRARKGTTLNYKLTGDARVLFTIERKKVTKKRGKKKKTTKYSVAGKFAAQGKAGNNKKKFAGRLGKKRLGPGSYRVTLVATDKAGRSSDPKQLTFSIVRR